MPFFETKIETRLTLEQARKIDKIVTLNPDIESASHFVRIAVIEKIRRYYEEK